MNPPIHIPKPRTPSLSLAPKHTHQAQYIANFRTHLANPRLGYIYYAKHGGLRTRRPTCQPPLTNPHMQDSNHSHCSHVKKALALPRNRSIAVHPFKQNSKRGGNRFHVPAGLRALCSALTLYWAGTHTRARRPWLAPTASSERSIAVDTHNKCGGSKRMGTFNPANACETHDTGAPWW